MSDAQDFKFPPILTIRVIDFETTGVGDDARVVEAGYCDALQFGGGEWTIGQPKAWLVNPGVPIPPEASAVHHIRDKDVATAEPIERVLPRLMLPPAGRRITHFAAHNAAFDRRFFGGGDLPWIDTLKVVYRAFPNAPRHNNQTLRYLLKLDDNPDWNEVYGCNPHGALSDAYVTAEVLRYILEKGMPAERMVEITKQPAILPRLLFGKHADKPWSEVPLDYLQWLVSNADDPDVKATARHWIKKAEAA